MREPHYAIGIDKGENFNRSLVEAVVPNIISSENLYRGRFTKAFCERSLLGSFSKVWFSKELTDPRTSRNMASSSPKP